MSAHPADLFAAFLKAREISECLLMAYANDPAGPASMRDIHVRVAKGELVNLAAALGYSVSQIETSPMLQQAAE